MGFFENVKDFKSNAWKGDIPFVIRGSLLFIHTTALIELWIDWAYANKKTDKLILRGAVRELISKTPGFLEPMACRRIKGKIYRCTVFNINEAPKALKEMINLKEAV